MKSSFPAKPSQKGFSLLEVLLSVATISVVCGIACLVLENALPGVYTKVKLPNDVVVLNNAVRSYLANGGSLSNVSSPQGVLDKLKTVASNRAEIAGVNGSMIDRRLTAVTEPGTSDLVAIWDMERQIFRIVERDKVPGGATPIAEFALKDSAANVVGSEVRQVALPLAHEGHWIWDFQDPAGPRTGPGRVRPVATASTPPQAPTSMSPIRLRPPTFSLPAGTYPLSQFPATLTLSNPNIPSISSPWITENARDWNRYASPVTVLPGTSLKAYAEALDSDYYSDSDTVTADYAAEKVDLRVGDDFRNSYAYGELGGPLAAGSVAPSPRAVGKLSLLNPEALPDFWENHDVFQMFWTKDGSDPGIASAARQAGNNTFVNTYPGDNLPLTLTDFATAPGVTLQYYAAGKNPSVVNSSPVTRKVIGRLSEPLLPPLVSPGDGTLETGMQITMRLDTTGGKTPAGARIYYRADGIDPGAGAEPNPGALEYLAGLSLPVGQGPVVNLLARTYPPADYKDWFTTSPLASRTFRLPSADQDFYGVLGGDFSLFVIDPAEGTSRLVDSSAPFKLRTVALDNANGRLYYTEDAGNGWRLGSYDLKQRTHTVLGTLASGRSYNASRQPENLGFYNGSLYYIHDRTDDLVRISLSGNTISAVSKVADLLNNTATFDQVGDLAVDGNGWMYFNNSNKRYYRYHLQSLSGLLQIGNTERENDALGMHQGRLYVADRGSKEIRSISVASGATLAKKTTSPERKFVDFGSPAPGQSSPGTSLWLIADTDEGPHLHEIRNYRNPATAEDVDYGVISYLDGTSSISLRDGTLSHIQGMCITSGGMLYFCRNFKTKVGGREYFRPLLRLNLSNLVPGDPLAATFVGDFTAGLAAIAGTIDPDDVVTGIGLSPAGEIYGVLREGLGSGVGGKDFLFRASQPAATLTGPQLPVTLVGKLTSGSATCTQSEDLAFAPNGTLYIADAADQQICTIDRATGSVLSVYSSDPKADYHSLAVDPMDNRLIACSYGTGAPANTLMKINGGDTADASLTDIGTLFNLANVEAMAFFQGTAVSSQVTPDLYGVDGGPTIYGLNIGDATTTLVTDAPYNLRALAYDFPNHLLYYVRDDLREMSLGSYNLVTGQHSPQGSLLDASLAYKPQTLPDNLCYFGGSLWYVPAQTDDLVRITLNESGTIASQIKAADLTGNTLSLDLVGDLAISPDGWMYFSAVNYEGVRFCRYKIASLSTFEVLAGPTPPTMSGNTPNFTENWLDAMAFLPPLAGGERPLIGSLASAPATLLLVSPADGKSGTPKPTMPAVLFKDFSDYHPGSLGASSSAATPVLALTNLAPGYTYADVGGEFLPGLLPAPARAASPGLILENANQIPLSLQSSTQFTVHWTYDGIDPRTSPGAVNGPAFSNGMPALPVPVDYARWGMRASLPLTAVAKSLQPQAITDSALVRASVPILKTTLRNPQVTILTDASGQRSVMISAAVDAGDCPPGTRIYYTTDGQDPGVTTASNGVEIPIAGSLYTGPIAVPNNATTEFVVTARVFPPQNLGAWFRTSDSDYISVPYGLAGGHMDVDTSHLLYAFRRGSTDGHVHMYDKKYNVVGESFFAFKTPTLKNIPTIVQNSVKFKIIVSNADLSRGGRLVINKTYNSLDPSTYTLVTKYDDTAPSALPIYSLDGLAGTTRLTQLGLYFDTSVIGSGGLIGTVTGAVRSNTPGLLGEWRNGALTVQLVRVNQDGSPAFTTSTSLSNGGVQGVATSGLLWETTFFWHHQAAAYGR